MKKICLKCGHEWVVRVKEPLCCPQCKTYNWNKLREENKDDKRIKH